MEKRISEHKVNSLLDALDKKLLTKIKQIDESQTKYNTEEIKKCNDYIEKL